MGLRFGSIMIRWLRDNPKNLSDLSTQWFQRLIDVTYMKIGWFLVELLMFWCRWHFWLGRCLTWGVAPPKRVIRSAHKAALNAFPPQLPYRRAERQKMQTEPQGVVCCRMR